MKNKFTIYEAGAISNLSFEEYNIWRVNAKRLLNITSDNQIHVINPVDFYNFNMNPNTYTEKEVKEYDLQMVKQSDLILVNLEHPNSIGTAMELFYASEVLHKPVIGFGINENRPPHPWVELCIDKFCGTLQEAVDYIIDYYFINY